MTEAKYPQAYVQLSGQDGNTGSIMARVVDAMKKEGASADEIKQFRLAIFNADSYSHVLRIVEEWVSVG